MDQERTSRPHGGVDPADEHHEESIITKRTSGSVSEALSRISSLAQARGMKVFAVIDHSGEAASCGLELRETKLVILGSPRAGTPVMVAVPLAALELPLKILVWADAGTTNISYTAPSVLKRRFALSDELAGPLAGLDAFTDAVASGA